MSVQVCVKVENKRSAFGLPNKSLRWLLRIDVWGTAFQHLHRKVLG